MIRQLTLFDLDDALKIARLKQRVGGTTPLSEERFNQIHEKYFHTDGIHFAFGYFDNNKLISFILFGLHENKSRGRFWYISFLYTSLFHNYFSFNNQEIGLLIKTAFNVAETMGHYEYYYTINKKFETLYDRQWSKNKFIPTGRYNLEILTVIPKNTLSTVDLYNRLLGSEIRPDDMVIKKRTLKDEFRNR